ncbi:MAG: MarR family winged helix-turn-helix transcriptional regulator [Pseudomonadota bacterium]
MSSSTTNAICVFLPPFIQFLRKLNAELGLSPARFQVMQALEKENELTMVELAERLSVSKRNITTLVDGMERDDLAGRHPHPSDRRSTLVKMTETGKSVYLEASSYQTERLDNLFAVLDRRQEKALIEALFTITEELTTNSKR